MTGSKELASTWVDKMSAKRDLIAGLLMTGLKIGRDNTGMGDLKMLHRAPAEMRHANKVFQPYRHVRARCPSLAPPAPGPACPPTTRRKSLPSRWWRKATWSSPGRAMASSGAAQHGAGREQSFGLNIRLPFEQSANDTIVGDEKLVTFNYFFTRKLSFVKEADAVALLPPAARHHG